MHDAASIQQQLQDAEVFPSGTRISVKSGGAETLPGRRLYHLTLRFPADVEPDDMYQWAEDVAGKVDGFFGLSVDHDLSAEGPPQGDWMRDELVEVWVAPSGPVVRYTIHSELYDGELGEGRGQA